MINLFETMNMASIDLLRSQLFANYKIPTVVIEDDGFLPEGVDSPIKFYGQFSDENNPLYFDQVKIPKFYRILATASKGEIYDLHQKKGEIIFIATDNNRLVKEVRWLGNNGTVSWIDHYNRQGKKFAKTFYENGKAAIRKYFNVEGHEIITRYMQTGDIFLHQNNETLYFTNVANFIRYYLKKRKYNLDHIFYNTLNQSLLTTLALDEKGTDTLFWDERTGESLPDNLEYLNNNRTRTKHVIFQNYLDWQNWKDKLPESKYVDFQFLGTIYPHPRGNKMRPEAVIMTNSDQIEHLEEIVTALPNIHFHIAAITEMSSKLLAFDKFNNVHLYPSVVPKKVKELYEKCDIYLDINHGNEILDSVRGAFEQNMLIVGFSNTLHNRNFIGSQDIFESTQVDHLINRISEALENTDVMRKLVDEQRLQAGDESIEKYRKVIGALKNEGR